jgi:ABC-type glycerol-3-phosphate transport system substrate-binding protein
VSDPTSIWSCHPGARWRAGATLLAALLIAGCSRHGVERAGSASATPPGATVAIAGTLFNGSDPDQIRAYLQTVKEITPVKFDVQWSPATVAVSKVKGCEV